MQISEDIRREDSRAQDSSREEKEDSGATAPSLRMLIS